MKLKSERIKELEHEKLELSRKLYTRNRQLDYTEKLAMERNEKIVELQEQLKALEDKYANTVWVLSAYVTFYEKAKELMEVFEEEKDKPMDIAIDLTNQEDPEVKLLCDFIMNILDKIANKEEG